MAKIRKSTYDYLRDILKDYNDIDAYIKQREKELRVPHRETDINADIKGTKASYDNQDNLMITIEQDRRLASLERNKRLVTAALEECDEDTKVIIEELYMKRWPTHTLQGLVDSKKVYCSRSKAFELKNKFFINLALKFNLDI